MIATVSLGGDILQPWQQLKAEELTECERHLALPMDVDVGSVDFGVGVMPESPLLPVGAVIIVRRYS